MSLTKRQEELMQNAYDYAILQEDSNDEAARHIRNLLMVIAELRQKIPANSPRVGAALSYEEEQVIERAMKHRSKDWISVNHISNLFELIQNLRQRLPSTPVELPDYSKIPELFDHSFQNELLEKLAAAMQIVPRGTNPFWKPYNRIGDRIDVDGRTAIIDYVLPPLDFPNEIERICVTFDDDKSQDTLPVRGVRIGNDWIR